MTAPPINCKKSKVPNENSYFRQIQLQHMDKEKLNWNNKFLRVRFRIQRMFSGRYVASSGKAINMNTIITIIPNIGRAVRAI